MPEGDDNSKLQNCETDPQIVMNINISFQTLKLMCLHPQNDSYPIFSANLAAFSIDIDKFFDHDTYGITIKTLELVDHTEYPNTLDPENVYSPTSVLSSSKILTRNDN